MNVETIGNATLYRADCVDVFALLQGIDVVISDPPFGMNFKGKQSGKRSGQQPLYWDDEAFYRRHILPRILRALQCAPRAAVFCGHKRMWEYPPPADVGGIFCSGSTSMSTWGFRCYTPVLFYGRSPYMKYGLGARPTAAMIQLAPKAKDEFNDHPCPKPLLYMDWVVRVASLVGETVLDPFMGSGTTGVVCAALGRRFVGIEVDPHFFDIACQRIGDAWLSMNK